MARARQGSPALHTRTVRYVRTEHRERLAHASPAKGHHSLTSPPYHVPTFELIFLDEIFVMGPRNTVHKELFNKTTSSDIYKMPCEDKHSGTLSHCATQDDT